MSSFAKPFPSENGAQEAVRRSMDLRTQGLATPVAHRDCQTVVFDRIVGTSGLPLVEAVAVDWLRPLAILHRCTVDDIPPCDPIRRIRPRLDLLTNPEIAEALTHLSRGVPAGGALLHGDFHLGQLIRDGQGTVWMIDLDDLCLGPPEADLANLIANLTTQSTLEADFRGRMTLWRARIVEAWTTLAAAPDHGILEHHLALALIRRHLKLREAGRVDFETEIAGWVTRAACRISPYDSAGYRG